MQVKNITFSILCTIFYNVLLFLNPRTPFSPPPHVISLIFIHANVKKAKTYTF